MKLKHLALVVAGLAAASALLLWLRKPASAPSGSDPRLGQPPIAADVLSAATTLRITAGGSTAELRQSPPSGWVVASYHDLPADFDRIIRLVRDLQAARVAQVATRNPDWISRFDFGATRLEVVDAAGTTTTLDLGKNADAGGRFIRFGSEPVVYRATFDAFLDGTGRNWARTELTKFTAADIKSVAAAFPSGASITASRESVDNPFAVTDSTALPDGRTFDPASIVRLVGTLGSLRFADTLDTTDPEVAAARAAARSFTFTQFDGTTWSVAIGRRPAPPPPPPAADGSTSPAPAAATTGTPPDPEAPPTEPAPAAPPAAPPPPAPGPVCVFVEHSDPANPVNSLMARRAFTIGSWIDDQVPGDVTGLLIAPPPPPAPAPEPASTVTPPVSVPPLLQAPPPQAPPTPPAGSTP